MADIILSVARDVVGSVVERLRERGETLRWRYRGSLSERLAGLRSGQILNDLPYTYHRVEVDDDLEDSEIIRIPLVCDRDRIDRVVAERNHRFSYSGIGLPFQKGGQNSNYLSKMEVSKAWAAGVDGSGVRVAVVDSGQDRLGYGKVKDYYDVENAALALHPKPPVPIDRDGHGTAMSALVREVAPGADICIVRISDQSPPLLWNLLAGVAVAAYDCNAEIINLSVGYSQIHGCACGAFGAARSLALMSMLSAITKSGFRIYVAATGNEFSKGGRFNDPAGFSDAVAVGSVNTSDYRSQYSNVGTANHPSYVLAPGGEENPAATVTEDVGTCGKSPQNPCYGTSVSAAYASGMLALLRSDPRHQNDSRDQFLNALPNYCWLPGHAQGNPAEYGKGILRYVPETEDEKVENELDVKMELDHDITLLDKIKLNLPNSRKHSF